MSITVKYTTTQGLYFLDAEFTFEIVKLSRKDITVNTYITSPDGKFPPQENTYRLAVGDTLKVEDLLKKIRLGSNGLTRKGAEELNKAILEQFYIDKEEPKYEPK